MEATSTLADLLATTEAEARPYQERVIQLAHHNFTELGVKTQLVNSPTGSGKTVMGLAVARWLQEQYDIGVGWCAMRRNLLHQVVDANKELGMGVDALEPISMFAKNPPLQDANGRPIKLLIVDEAQHDAASSMGHLHNTITPQWVLGLSATPYRTDKLKLCFEKVIRDAGIHQLIQQGYLAQYHQYTLTEWTVDSVVERYLAEPDTWGKSVMYWLNEGLARNCLSQLQQAGVRVEFIYGAQTGSHREDLLSRFDKTTYGDGDPEGIDVLVNMFILTEGWDCTSLKTAWVRDSQRGPTIQMAGRAFRRSPHYDFKQIVQSKNTRWPMQKTADPNMSYIWTEDTTSGGEWRSVKPSAVTHQVSNRALLTLAHTQTEMPAFILKRKGKWGGRTDRTDTESGLGRRANTGNNFDDGGAFIH
jgi:superfamily II DNA or RNA helicase